MSVAWSIGWNSELDISVTQKWWRPPTATSFLCGVIQMIAFLSSRPFNRLNPILLCYTTELLFYFPVVPTIFSISPAPDVFFLHQKHVKGGWVREPCLSESLWVANCIPSCSRTWVSISSPRSLTHKEEDNDSNWCHDFISLFYSSVSAICCLVHLHLDVAV